MRLPHSAVGSIQQEADRAQNSGQHTNSRTRPGVGSLHKPPFSVVCVHMGSVAVLTEFRVRFGDLG